MAKAGLRGVERPRDVAAPQVSGHEAPNIEEALGCCLLLDEGMRQRWPDVHEQKRAK